MLRGLIFVSLFFLLACEADPGLKKWPKGDPRFVSKGIGVNFFPKADILFVIDDSGSMYDFQQALSRNVESFVDEIFRNQFIDFHIGVTTSNERFFSSTTWGGRLISTFGPNYVENKTPDAKLILKDYLTPGTFGSGTEIFFRTVVKALTPPLVSVENRGFYRPDAHLLVFFLTDADDQSLGFGAKDFHDFLLNLKLGDSSKIHFAAAIPPVGGTCETDEDPAIKIEEFTKLVKGTNFNICDADYGVELVRVAHDIIEKISTIQLDEVPILSTIKISYGSQVIPQAPGIGWTYNPDKNVIYLGKDIDLKPEPAGTRLNIDFEAVYK